jgi:hypothetical protein
VHCPLCGIFVIHDVSETGPLPIDRTGPSEWNPYAPISPMPEVDLVSETLSVSNIPRQWTVSKVLFV